jgi:anti-sigma regulatory factor (Ser/Thr protein kinase)
MAQNLTETPVVLQVTGPAEAHHASDSARSFADSLGFAETQCAEIALVVSELASNLIRHASGGTIAFSMAKDSARRGLRIESRDNGPGIADVERAMTDGYSTAGSLGTGLGTVNRLMDELEIFSNEPAGARIICQRWLRPAGDIWTQCHLAFGAATRACRLDSKNGDAFIIKRWENNALVGVIDGLGHGQFAQRASHTARHYIEQHFDQSLENLFRGVGLVCRTTRGVVMALACFDMARRKVRVASVGNVEMRLFGSLERFNPIIRRGIIGLNAPNPVCTEHAWTADSFFILHSDGLGTHWNWSDFRSVAQASPSILAGDMLRRLGKMEDDATVVVVKNGIA